jgi:UDP-2,4-diacetamido-2,4,6-trideoxy-beta-L-altropyranose hydrolase
MIQRCQVIFRVDGGKKIGSGHVVRCMTLARELQVLKCDTCFIMRESDGNLSAMVEKAGFEVRLLEGSHQADMKFDLDTGPMPVQMQLEDARQTLDTLKDWLFDWVVVDHYGLGIEWETELRSTGANICAIDDLANRQHECEGLLDANYLGATHTWRYESLVPSNCLMMVGPTFSLLQTQYASIHAVLPYADGMVRRILVFFGGSDSSNQSSKVLDALSSSDLEHLAVDLVLGIDHSHRDQIDALASSRGNVNIHNNLGTLAGLMARADFAIGAGGITTWERMSCGVPSLIVAVASNQERVISALTTDGFVASLTSGKHASCEEWRDAIRTLVSDRVKLAAMGEKGRCLVDGLGAKYVAHLLISGSLDKIRLRSAHLEDEYLLLKWAKDLDTKRQSFTFGAITAKQHAELFCKKLVDSNSYLLIGESESGLPVGQALLVIDDIGEAVINISIDSRLRGSGLGSKLLKCVLEKFKAEAPSLSFKVDKILSDIE